MNNIAVVVMLYLIVSVLVVTFLEGCFSAVPAQFHAVRAKWVWFLLAPVGLRLLNEPAVRGTLLLFGGILPQLSSPVIWAIADTSISVADIPLRCLIFVGLARTFRRYFAAKEIRKDLAGVVLAWALCVFETAAFAGSAVAVYWMLTHSFADPDRDRPIWVQLFTDGPPLVGTVHALLLMIYLVTMNSLKSAVLTAERRERLTAIQKRPAVKRESAEKPEA